MKILQINVTANWGSTGRIAEQINLQAQQRGWDTYIAYGRYSSQSQSHLIKVGNRYDVYAHYLRHRFFDGEGLGSEHATQRLVEDIQRLQPDIIHLHNIHDHWLNYPILFEYFINTDIPIVWTFHDCWAFTGHCFHFENAKCCKWLEQCKKCKQIPSLSSDNTCRNYDLKKELFTNLGQRLTIVPVSQWLGRYVRSSILKDCRIETIYNGIDTETFRMDATTGKRRMILGVSNVWPKDKGLSDFIKLRKVLPRDIEIMLVGLTKKQIRELPKGIKGIERTANIRELINLYQYASAFVNLTRNDTFPTVNIEALACGTPVITYRTGGSPEAIDGETGIIVEKGDVEGTAAAIRRIMENPAHLTPENCRRRAVENFNKDQQFAKYISLYESLLH